MFFSSWSILLYLGICFQRCSAVVFTITKDNHTVLAQYHVALVAYCAEWCYFSRQLAPIFSEASEQFVEDTKNARVLFGRVDCDVESDLCKTQMVTKYPTIKLIKYGITMKKEYRGQRNPQAFVEFVKSHIVENITSVDGHQRSALEAAKEISDTRDAIIGTFTTNDTSNRVYQYFRMVAHLERDDCAFFVINNVSDSDPKLFVKDALTSELENLPISVNSSFADLTSTIMVRCTPLVRELTFANAEEITDERLPLVLLFYNAQTVHLKVKYRDLIKKHLADHRKTVNFLTADGHQFSHPLSHMGKSTNDLPFICIDSLVHMYVHPKSVDEVLSNATYLNTFIQDLHSGKLHKEYHYGPEHPAEAAQPSSSPGETTDQTTPPESAFKKLQPSYLKYTLMHDEL